MKLHVTALGLMAAVAAPAHSQEKDFRVRVGLGAQVRPDFIGARHYEAAPLWDIDFASWTNEFRFEAPDDSFGLPIITKGSFATGPAFNLASGRKDSDVGAAVGNVATTLEAGAFMQYDLNKSLRVRADLRKGVNGHKGVIGAVGADYIWRDGDKYVFSIGPRVLFSDERYQRAFFEVTAAASLATGLPVYRPRAGVHAVAVATGLSYQFNPRFGLFGFARYERLIGDAAKSPIVRVLGSRDQASAGVGLSYTFTVRR